MAFNSFLCWLLFVCRKSAINSSWAWQISALCSLSQSADRPSVYVRASLRPKGGSQSSRLDSVSRRGKKERVSISFRSSARVSTLLWWAPQACLLPFSSLLALNFIFFPPSSNFFFFLLLPLRRLCATINPRRLDTMSEWKSRKSPHYCKENK